MATNNESITFKGNPIEVSGLSLKIGQVVPDFVLSGADLSDLSINDFQDKVLIISIVPSLDTAICSLQTKRFNEEASKLSDGVAILTVSRDLPMAQKRWCGAEGVDAVVCASDYKYRTFGDAFGVGLDGLGLLARAVFVVDKEGVIQHLEYVDEVTQEPDYDAALGKVGELVTL